MDSRHRERSLRSPLPDLAPGGGHSWKPSIGINACARCAAEMPEQQFNTWVRHSHAIEVPGALKLLASNRFRVEWVATNLLPRIFVLLSRDAATNAPRITIEVGARAAEPPSLVRPVAALTLRRTPGLVVGAHLQTDYTFSAFIRGQSNQFARDAALEVAENPGRAYNPCSSTAVLVWARPTSDARHCASDQGTRLRSANCVCALRAFRGRHGPRPVIFAARKRLRGCLRPCR